MLRTWSRSVGGAPLCCTWFDIWTSLVETPRCIGKKVRPVVVGSLGALDSSFRGRSDAHCSKSYEQRRRLSTVVLLFWTAQGFKLIWNRRPERPKSRVCFKIELQRRVRLLPRRTAATCAQLVTVGCLETHLIGWRGDTMLVNVTSPGRRSARRRGGKGHTPLCTCLAAHSGTCGGEAMLTLVCSTLTVEVLCVVNEGNREKERSLSRKR